MNKAKQSGTRFETDVVRYLQPDFPEVERRALAGSKDKGDIKGIPGWTAELKANKAYLFSQALRQAEVEARNAGTKWYVAIMKRHQHSTEDAFAIMSLRQWKQLVKELPS